MKNLNLHNELRSFPKNQKLSENGIQTISQKINEEIANKHGNPRHNEKRFKFPIVNMEKINKLAFRKLAVPMLALVLVILSSGVAAAYLSAINNVLALISPEVALMLQPIEKKSVSNGIESEVVAALNDNEMAVIYIALKDLKGGRIDETVDLYDFSLSGAQIFNSKIVAYDKTTDTATLRIQANGGESINNKKMKFSITSFLSGKQTYKTSVEVNLPELTSKSPQIIPVEMDDIPGGGGSLFQELKEQRTVEILKPNQTKIELPEINFLRISSIGLVNKRLHVQAEWLSDDIDSHGDFYLVDQIGNKVEPSTINFATDKEGNAIYGSDHTEYIFELDNVDLDHYSLKGEFVKNSNYTKGNWSTTFKLNSVAKEKKLSFNKNFGSWKAENITVSPLGVTLYGKGNFVNSNTIELSVLMNDGSVQRIDSMISFSNDKKVVIKFIPKIPLDTSLIKTISVNGKDIIPYND
jgi:hypothetical protein